MPIPGTTKLHRIEENLGAVNVELTPDLKRIDEASSSLKLKGARLPEAVLKYRTAPLQGETDAQLGQAGGALFGAQVRNYALIAEDGKYAPDDGVQAIKVVCTHAVVHTPGGIVVYQPWASAMRSASPRIVEP